MSNARKLQTEIERCMKKVDEGVELFDEIWEKVYSAEQQNQKEKYEMDLKKEIKKLQRQRDQIKTWISSSEVKDKDPLIEARKLIESKMEQFKICEKETKTKTYSKEGLAREDKLDPEEEAKLKTTTWLSDYIEKFNTELETQDFEIERLSAGKGKKQHKAQLEALQQHVRNHKFHINKLEGIIRLVNNDRLDVEVVDPLKEDLDYYLESYQDDDYAQAYDEEYFYEALGLEELDIVNVDRVTQSSKNDGDSKSNKKSDDATSTSSRGSKETKKASKKNSVSSVIPLTIGRARSKAEKADKAAKKEAEKEHAEEKVTPSKSARSASTSNKAAAAVPAPPPTTATQPPGTSMAAILKRESEQQEKERQQKLLREQQAKAQAAEQLRQQQQQQALAAQQKQQQEALQRQQQEAALRLKQQQQAEADALRQQQELQKQQQQELQKQQQDAAAAAAKQAELASQQQAPPAPIGASAADPSDVSVATATTASSNPQPTQPSSQMVGQQLPQAQQPTNAAAIDILTAGLGGLGLGGATNAAANARPAGAEGSTLPSMGAAAAATAGDNNRLLRPPAHVSSALSESFAAVPNSGDHERTGSSAYSPQNPYHSTPPQYPTQPSAIFEKPEVFEKLGTDALFFIFYYAQGSYQQYLAARELKKQSWRFHKKYMTWFQRHEEPQITTDEYEQGTYVYFDYETGWCTRIKQDFRFEYSFLEDAL